MKKEGFDIKQKDKLINNLPKEKQGILTGNYKIDFYGCWWEYVLNSTKETVWLIGEYPL